MSDVEKLKAGLKDRYDLERDLGADGIATRTAGWTDGLTDVRI